MFVVLRANTAPREQCCEPGQPSKLQLMVLLGATSNDPSLDGSWCCEPTRAPQAMRQASTAYWVPRLWTVLQLQAVRVLDAAAPRGLLMQACCEPGWPCKQLDKQQADSICWARKPPRAPRAMLRLRTALRATRHWCLLRVCAHDSLRSAPFNLSEHVTFLPQEQIGKIRTRNRRSLPVFVWNEWTRDISATL